MSRSVYGQWPGAPASEPAERGESMCRADDLKGLLERLSEQIADADRRHAESMREMQSRLVRLGDQSEQVKAALPEGKAAAFERVEQGMANLAERLADGGRPSTRPASDPASAHEAPDVFASRGPHDLTPAADLRTTASPSAVDSLPTSADRIEVPVLASAMLAATAAGAVRNMPAVGEPVAAAPAEASPAAPSVPREDIGFRHYPDEPWDQHSAAALARLYDSGEPGLPPRQPAHEVPVLVSPAVAGLLPTAAPIVAEPVRALEETAPTMSAPVPPPATLASPAAAAPEIERAWLEERLAEVARRVEASLVELKPDSSLLALGARFEQFEQRFTSVLDDVATRSDVEGLRLVEAHIAELSGQLEQAQAQLARLDAIESQFSELREKLSDEQILQLFGGLVPTEQDLTRFAEQAAEKVADRVIAQLPAPAEPMALAEPVQQDGRTIEQMEQLNRLMSSFIDERRKGEATTADALETIQLAMQQMLDRVDALEQSRALDAAMGSQRAERAAPATTHIEGHHATVVEPRLEAPSGDAKANLASEIRTFAEEAKAAARAAGGSGAAVAQRATQRPEVRASAVSTDDEATRPTGTHQSAGKTHGGTADPFDRARFVALARQAADKAQSGDGKPAAAPAMSADPAADRAAQKKSVTDKLLGAADAGKPKAAVRPGMLLVASVAFLVMAGAVFLLPKFRGGSAPVRTSPVSEAPVDPRAAKSSRSAPALADEDEARARPQRFDIPDTPSKGERRADGSGTGELQPTLASAAPGEALPVPTAGAPASLGIALEGTGRAPTIDEVMRARHRAQLATLSERTAQHAAATSTIPDASAPGEVREANRSGSGEERGSGAVEMPPAMVGPNSLRLAAQRGDASAQFEVAARFAEGKGVKQDFEQAFVWYQRAASQGLAQAQYRLATLFERGLGTKADLGRARAWYLRAAEQGNLKAMHNLAVLAAGRDQAQPDYPTAVQWFTRAAEHGLADSQFNLGILSESGLGVARDPITALKWYVLAANAGDREAIRRRDGLRGKLDAIAVKEAEDAVADWRPKPADRMANDARVAGEAWKRRTGEAR